MDVPKININTKYIQWCQSFMKEQAETTRLARRVLRQSRVFNPFNKNRDIDRILKRYEKSFWG